MHGASCLKEPSAVLVAESVGSLEIPYVAVSNNSISARLANDVVPKKNARELSFPWRHVNTPLVIVSNCVCRLWQCTTLKGRSSET
jgi:hypothetical protein